MMSLCSTYQSMTKSNGFLGSLRSDPAIGIAKVSRLRVTDRLSATVQRSDGLCGRSDRDKKALHRSMTNVEGWAASEEGRGKIHE